MVPNLVLHYFIGGSAEVPEEESRIADDGGIIFRFRRHLSNVDVLVVLVVPDVVFVVVERGITEAQ